MDIPNNTFLEENTTEWTPIRFLSPKLNYLSILIFRENKLFECKDKQEDESHTRFLEENRLISNFSLYCLEDGSFESKDWPLCYEG